MSARKRVAIVVGIRPHFTKLTSFYRPLRAGNDVAVIHTGQHHDHMMTTRFLDEAGLPEPDVSFEVGSGTHAEQTARGLVALEGAFTEYRPDLVLSIGDGNPSLAAALTAAKLGIRVAHLEAGVRSFDRTLPEEVNRIAIDALSNLHLTTTPSAHKRLSSAVFVGDPLLDVILSWMPRIAEAARAWSAEGSVLATFHRARTLRDPALLAGVVRGLISIDAPVVCVLHPGTERALRETGLLDVLQAADTVRVLPALGHLDLLGLILACERVLTDSNGVQRESLYLGRPCFIMRESTEFPETLELGAGALVGTDPSAIANAQSIVDIDLAVVHRMFGGGEAGGRIAEAVGEARA